MKYIILMLIIIPALEIGILIFSGEMIGLIPTIVLIIFTGVFGAYLAKKQGLEAIRQFQEQLSHGQMPGMAILDGVCILIGGILLLTPGFITDIFGFLLLVPPTRKFIKVIMMNALRKWINNGNIKIIK